MSLIKYATLLISTVSLFGFSGCASHEHTRRDSSPARNYPSSKDGRHFNLATSSYDPSPPFGPVGNGSLY